MKLSAIGGMGVVLHERVVVPAFSLNHSEAEFLISLLKLNIIYAQKTFGGIFC
jgi:hypothetical protein